MTGEEFFVVYLAPFILVIGGAMLAWRNRISMQRARARDAAVPSYRAYQTALETIRKFDNAAREQRDGRWAAE